jgi:hypothetical protein
VGRQSGHPPPFCDFLTPINKINRSLHHNRNQKLFKPNFYVLFENLGPHRGFKTQDRNHIKNVFIVDGYITHYIYAKDIICMQYQGVGRQSGHPPPFCCFLTPINNINRSLHHNGNQKLFKPNFYVLFENLGPHRGFKTQDINHIENVFIVNRSIKHYIYAKNIICMQYQGVGRQSEHPHRSVTS